MLIVGKLEAFQPPLQQVPGFVVPSYKPWFLEYVHFEPFYKNSDSGGVIIKFTSASLLFIMMDIMLLGIPFPLVEYP